MSWCVIGAVLIAFLLSAVALIVGGLALGRVNDLSEEQGRDSFVVFDVVDDPTSAPRLTSSNVGDLVLWRAQWTIYRVSGNPDNPLTYVTGPLPDGTPILLMQPDRAYVRQVFSAQQSDPNKLLPAIVLTGTSLTVGASGELDISTPSLPGFDLAGYDFDTVALYLEKIQNPNVGAGQLLPFPANGVTLNGRFFGAMFSNIEQSVFFMPYFEKLLLMKMDASGVFTTAAHGQTLIGAAPYRGGTFAPLLNRVYLAPMYMGPEMTWHFIDCATNTLVPYPQNSGVTATGEAYFGAVFSPLNNRVYFVPSFMAPKPEWHYIDCDTGNVVSYMPGAGASTAANQGFADGAYSPTQDRIYFAPYTQGDEPLWIGIECSSGNAFSYPAPPGVTSNVAYVGAVYSPRQNRIYFMPNGVCPDANWHYINCDTGVVVAYANGITPALGSSDYNGGTYEPTTNRIYLTPWNRSEDATWHYIDCNDGSVQEYVNDSGTVIVGAYRGRGAYHPSLNRVILAPYNAFGAANWAQIQPLTTPAISDSFAANIILTSQ